MRDAPAAAGAESESERDERYEEFGRKVLAYMRGKDDEEGEEGLFRDREHPLGDIVNSKARFVGDGPTSGAVNTKASYIEFLSSIEGREPMLYVGSNDGFLHGFSARSGRELVAAKKITSYCVKSTSSMGMEFSTFAWNISSLRYRSSASHRIYRLKETGSTGI